MSGVDDVIARHQKRLERHREFLRNNQPSGGQQMGGSAPTSGRSSRQQSDERRGDSYGADAMIYEAEADANGAVAVGSGAVEGFEEIPNDDAYVGSAVEGDAQGGAILGFDAVGSPPHQSRGKAPVSAARHRGHHEQDGWITGGGAADGSPYSQRSSTNQTGAFSPMHFTNPRMQERYVTKSPSRLYERGQHFKRAHERNMARIREERASHEFDGCTFAPSRDVALEALQAGRDDAGTGSQARVNRSANSQRRAREIEQQQYASEPVEEPSPVRPTKRAFLRQKSPATSARSNGSQRGPSSEDLHLRLESNRSQLTLSPSVCNHVARQQAARHQKRESTRKAAVDGSGWTGATTIPKEFNFANRVMGISSLRKPVIMDCGLGGGVDGKQKASKEAADNEALYVRARATTPRARGQQERQDLAGVPHHRDPDAEYAPSEPQASAPAVPINVPALPLPSNQDRRSASAASSGSRQINRERVDLRENELHDLRGLVDSLQRELKVAKTKVREVTLNANHPQIDQPDAEVVRGMEMDL